MNTSFSLKVLVVTTSFPRWQEDGHGVFVWELCHALKQQGAEVTVIAMHAPGAKRQEVWEGITIYRPLYWISENDEILRREGGGIPTAWQRYPLKARLQVLTLFTVYVWFALRLVSKYHCDLIHAHWTLPALAAYPAARKAKLPLVVTVQGSDILTFARGGLIRTITGWTLRHADHVVSLSAKLQQEVRALEVPLDRTSVIPNGVNTSRFTPGRQREPLILFVGSLIERKGVRFLIEAFRQISNTLPDFKLVLIGEGPQEQMLRAQVSSAGLSERVHFLGQQPRAEVTRWMQRARLLVLPSLEEGMGVAVVEALACGTPVVASAVDGIVDVVTPEVGLLVPPADAASLAEGIVQVLSNLSAWEKMSARARERAIEIYDWQRVALQYLQRFNLLKRDASRPSSKNAS